MQGAPITTQTNVYAKHTDTDRIPQIAAMTARGSACFNHELYKRKNSLPIGDDKGLWEHYVQYGQFEGRTAE